MKITPFSLLLPGLALCGVAMAEIPKKVPETRYSSLWNNSPFTTKPPPEADAPVANPLEDYALIGVSSIGQDSQKKSLYRVTMISKKSPDERIYVESGSPHKEGFKIVSVAKDKYGDPLGTTVKMTSGSQTGTLKFDGKLLTLAAPPAPVNNAAPQNPGQPQVQPAPGQQPQQNQQNQQPMRQPRARVVPPPNAANNNAAAGQQPQGQQVQGQGGQRNNNNNNNERRDRRRP